MKSQRREKADPTSTLFHEDNKSEDKSKPGVPPSDLSYPEESLPSRQIAGSASSSFMASATQQILQHTDDGYCRQCGRDTDQKVATLLLIQGKCYYCREGQSPPHPSELHPKTRSGGHKGNLDQDNRQGSIKKVEHEEEKGSSSRAVRWGARFKLRVDEEYAESSKKHCPSCHAKLGGWSQTNSDIMHCLECSHVGLPVEVHKKALSVDEVVAERGASAVPDSDEDDHRGGKGCRVINGWAYTGKGCREWVGQPTKKIHRVEGGKVTSGGKYHQSQPNKIPAVELAKSLAMMRLDQQDEQLDRFVSETGRFAKEYHHLAVSENQDLKAPEIGPGEPAVAVICGSAAGPMSTCQRPGCQSFGTGYKPDGTLRSSCIFHCINGAHVGDGEGQDCICESCQQTLKDDYMEEVAEDEWTQL